MENKLKDLGVNCPKCQSFIHTPLEQILFGSKFECDNCFTKFSLNETSKAQVLNQLQEINFSF